MSRPVAERRSHKKFDDLRDAHQCASNFSSRDWKSICGYRPRAAKIAGRNQGRRVGESLRHYSRGKGVGCAGSQPLIPTLSTLCRHDRHSAATSINAARTEFSVGTAAVRPQHRLRGTAAIRRTRDVRNRQRPKQCDGQQGQGPVARQIVRHDCRDPHEGKPA